MSSLLSTSELFTKHIKHIKQNKQNKGGNGLSVRRRQSGFLLMSAGSEMP